MIKKEDFKAIMEETLKKLGKYSSKVSMLIMGTVAQESRFKYKRQLGGGPALGYIQMEPNTHDDIVNNYLKYKPDLSRQILEISNVDQFNSEYLVENVIYQVCMCRVHYLRVSASIPEDLEGIAQYYKKYYNTYLGAATVEEFLENYEKYVA